MASVRKDIRYSMRVLRSNPGFTAIAVIALALGIGANTAIFSVVNAVLLRPLPIPHPEQVMVIHDQFTTFGLPSIGVSGPDFIDISARKDVFQYTAAGNIMNYNITGTDKPERLLGMIVTSGFFPLMGASPVAGRWFSADEDKPGANRVVVISDGLWRRRYAANPKLVGQTISLNGANYTVLGIAPPSLQIFTDFTMDLWTPIGLKPEQLDPVKERGHQWLYMLARRAPGVSADQAQAAMALTAKRFQEQYPNNFPASAGWGIQAVPLLEEIVGDTRKALWVLLAAVAFVLLIACANVANLMLARASARYREIAVRTALGASRWHIVRQLLTESVMLALLGGALGLLLATWGVELLRLLGPQNLPRIGNVNIDISVLLFTLAASVSAGVLFGLAPAFQVSRSDLHETLKEGGRGGATASVQRQRLRKLLVVSEVALALMLLVGAGLLIRSFMRLGDVRPGFDAKNLLTLNLSLPDSRYDKQQKIATFYDTVLQHVSSLPGVQGAAATSGAPFGVGANSGSFNIESRPVPKGGAGPHSDIRVITPAYFRAMRIPVLQGRDLTAGDVPESQQVVIIDEVLAKTYWHDENPMGRRITFNDADKGPFYTIVGIVGNVQHRQLDTAPKGAMYFVHTQSPNPVTDMTLVVRTAGEPTLLANAIRNEVLGVDRDQPVYGITTMEQRVTDSLARKRFAVLLLATFAGLALLLAAVGIYGVMSFSVTQKTHEIGIRMALGARQADVLQQIVWNGLLLALMGVGVGLIGSALLTRLISNMLYGVSTTDPATFLSVAGILTAVAALASYVPARRATKVDPMIALRYE